jgi:hypothetical protein
MKMRFGKGHEFYTNLDFGRVVKILGIAVKKEAGDELETSGWRNIVKPQTTKVSQNGPVILKAAQKGAQRFFNFKKFEIIKF